MRLHLCAWVGEMRDRRFQPVCAAGSLDALGQLADAVLFGELVEHAELSAVRWVECRQLHASHRVANVEKAARLTTFTVNGERMPDRALRAESVEDSAPDVVVVEACAQLRVQVGLGRSS